MQFPVMCIKPVPFMYDTYDYEREEPFYLDGWINPGDIKFVEEVTKNVTFDLEDTFWVIDINNGKRWFRKEDVKDSFVRISLSFIPQLVSIGPEGLLVKLPD